MARTISRGMLLVKGVTYRIERTAPHCYAVVRLLDDVEVGTFRTRPSVRVQPVTIDAELLTEIVRAAMRSARTSGVMHVAPVYEPDRESSPSVLPDPLPPTQAVRSPSSAPPPSPPMP